MSVSVIIPTLNAGKYIEKLIAALDKQDKVVDEIIIVDSGSIDQTLALAEQAGAGILKVAPGDFDHGGTRNFAARKTHGDILFFMTQDALPFDDSIVSRLTSSLQDPQIALAYARQIPLPGSSLSDHYLRHHHYPLQSMLKGKKDLDVLGIKTFQCSNVCAAYRRDIFEKLNGFPELVVCNEDMLFAAKAIMNGWKVFYNAEAKVWHSHHNSLTQLYRRYFDIAVSLEREPLIQKTGKINRTGYEFFSGYLVFLIKQRKVYHLPKALLELSARFLGFKTGRVQRFIPLPLRKKLGLNESFWRQQAFQKGGAGS